MIREYSVEILDNQFSPARIIVEEGDRVRFSWNKERVIINHFTLLIFIFKVNFNNFYYLVST